jgi:hypothetical protein
MRVEISISRDTLAATFSAMREWLDSQGWPDVRFETATVGKLLQIAIELKNPALAREFERAFGDGVRKAA